MPYPALGTPLMHCQVSHVSNHFAVISWATICCLLTKMSNFLHTCDKTTLHAVIHTQTHTRCTHTRDRHTYREHTSGIISTCTTCIHLSTTSTTSQRQMDFDLPPPTLLSQSPLSLLPPFALPLLFHCFFAIVNGNFAATETFCFLLLSITNSFVIFRLHNWQQQQQQRQQGGGGEASGRQQNGAHVRTKFCLRLAAALSCFAGTEGASCRFVYRLNLRHNAKMFETYWKLTPCLPPFSFPLLFAGKRSFSLAFPIKEKCVRVLGAQKKRVVA